MPLFVPARRCRTERSANRRRIGVSCWQVAIPRAQVIKFARAHSELILELATGAIWIHRDRSVAWLVEIIPTMAASDRAAEPVFFAPGVSFSFPLALIAGNRESLEHALSRDIELARAVAAGEVLIDRGGAAPLVLHARQLIAAPTAWKVTERRLKSATAPDAASSTELDALLERRRSLEQSIHRARAVFASEPNMQLQSVCIEATRALVEVRAQIDAELAAERRRTRGQRGVDELEESQTQLSDPRTAADVARRA